MTRRAFRCALPMLLGAPLYVGAAPAPPAGGFGFDWLRPKAARCQAIPEHLSKRFRRCEQRDGAFGLADRVYVCKLDERSEYLIFETEAACKDNLETMKANAP